MGKNAVKWEFWSRMESYFLPECLISVTIQWFQTVTLLIFWAEQSWLCANSSAIWIWQYLWPNKLRGRIPSQSFVANKISLEISKYLVEVVAPLGSEPKQALTSPAPSNFIVHWQVGSYSYQWGWEPTSSPTAKITHILK